MAEYHALTATPALVQRALALAKRQQFASSCTPEVGRLLATLAAHVHHGIIGEIGTGCGVGTAWLASALAPTTRLVTVERDTTRATASRELFAALENVTVLHGDWRQILPHGPFDLLFADTPAKRDEPEALLATLRLGGLVVLDDLTPEEHWPPSWCGQPDPVRDFWLNDPRLRATELLTTPTTAVIVATRLA
jgi:predicted O-methyltransferase YrrM